MRPEWRGNVSDATRTTATPTPTCKMEPAIRKSGGFDFPVDPELTALETSAPWTPRAAPAVVTILAPLPQSAGALETMRVKITQVPAGQPHIGNQNVAILALTKTTTNAVGILLPLDAHWQLRVEAATRARAFLTGQPTKPVIPAEHCRRLGSALRVHDGRLDQATYRDLGTALFGKTRIADEPWKTSPLKAQVARLAQYGRKMVASGYRSLLHGRTRPRG